jgi:hypothetical protein
MNTLFFESSDCTGQAYFDTNVGPILDQNSIMSYRSATFKLANATTTINEHSQEAGQCFVDTTNTNDTFKALVPVTLPYNLDNVTAPFAIQ